MGAEELTDAEIERLIAMGKRVVESPKKARVKGKQRELDYQLIGADGVSRFAIYARQNTKLQDDFSCGLRWDSRTGDSVTLVRYNGNDHPHINPIERTRFPAAFHIHRAREVYIKAGYDFDKYAEVCARYSNLMQALDCLIVDCHVEGLVVPLTQGSLFG